MPLPAIRITSWNMGATIADFELRDRDYQSLTVRDKEKIKEDHLELYSKMDGIAAEMLFSDKTSLGSIVLLQENMKKEEQGEQKERREVTQLRDLGYQVIEWDSNRAKKFGPDLSIAIDNKRFKHEETLQKEFQNGSKAIIAIVKDKAIKKPVAFVSIVIAGSKLTGHPKTDDELGNFGTQDCQSMIDWIKESCHQCQFVCLGGDFNANPECMPTRFKLFEESGFKTLRVNEPTERNYSQYGNEPNNYNERELDFFMILPKKLTSKVQVIAEPQILGEFEFHGSDHAPIQTKIAWK